MTERVKTTPAQTSVKVNDVPLATLLAAGANASMITMDALKQLPVGSYELQNTDESVKLMNGQKVRFLGRTALQVHVCAGIVTMSFGIVEQFKGYDLVLGTDELFRLGLNPQQLLTMDHEHSVPQLMSVGWP